MSGGLVGISKKAVARPNWRYSLSSMWAGLLMGNYDQ